MNKLTTIAVVTATLTVATAGFAGGAIKYAHPVSLSGPYISVEGGLAIKPQGKNMHSTGNKENYYKTGWNLGGAIGYKIENVRGEFQYTFIRHAINTKATLPGGTPVDSTKGDHLSQNLFMLNGYYDIPVRQLTLSLGAGLGVAHATSLYSADTEAHKMTPTAFALELNAGAAYNITQHISLGVVYRFIPALYKGQTDHNKLGHVYNNLVNANLTFRF